MLPGQRSSSSLRRRNLIGHPTPSRHPAAFASTCGPEAPASRKEPDSLEVQQAPSAPYAQLISYSRLQEKSAATARKVARAIYEEGGVCRLGIGDQFGNRPVCGKRRRICHILHLPGARLGPVGLHGPEGEHDCQQQRHSRARGGEALVTSPEEEVSQSHVAIQSLGLPSTPSSHEG